MREFCETVNVNQGVKLSAGSTLLRNAGGADTDSKMLRENVSDIKWRKRRDKEALPISLLYGLYQHHLV